ncbi:MAG: hypothetical protein ACHREM_07425 [Polyangiales bacterium]
MTAAALGCGARSSLGLSAPAADAGVLAPDSSGDSRPTPIDGASCSAAAAGIADQVKATPGSCTTVVRIDAATLAPTAYRILCAAPSWENYVGALEAASADTKLPFLACDPPPPLSGETPADEFVFVLPGAAGTCAGSADGWVTATSVRTTLTVLGGVIGAGATSRGLVYPTAWRPTSEIGVGCTSVATMTGMRGWDTTGPASPLPALDASILSSVTKALQNTALLDGLAKAGSVFESVVLKYSPTTTDPSAEYLVMVNSGP